MAKAKTSHEGTWIDAIVTDPANPPRLRVIAGYRGKSDREGFVRFYRDLTLSSWQEAAEEHLAGTHETMDPLGLPWTTAWVRDTAPAEAGAGQFFAGPVARAAAPAAIQPVATLTCPRPLPSFCPNTLSGVCATLTCPSQLCPVTAACPTVVCPATSFCPAPTAGCPWTHQGVGQLPGTQFLPQTQGCPRSVICGTQIATVAGCFATVDASCLGQFNSALCAPTQALPNSECCPQTTGCPETTLCATQSDSCPPPPPPGGFGTWWR